MVYQIYNEYALTVHEVVLKTRKRDVVPLDKKTLGFGIRWSLVAYSCKYCETNTLQRPNVLDDEVRQFCGIDRAMGVVKRQGLFVFRVDTLHHEHQCMVGYLACPVTSAEILKSVDIAARLNVLEQSFDKYVPRQRGARSIVLG